MANKTDQINHDYVRSHYTRLLKKRFGINSCVILNDFGVLLNKKILSDKSNYRDITSPVVTDRILNYDCKDCQTTVFTGNNWRDNYHNLPQPIIPIVPPITIIPVPLSVPPIEVKVGSAEALRLNILAGSGTIENDLFVGKYVEIFRNNINLPSIDYEDGSAFFTKSLNSKIIILSVALFDGEFIKIKVIA